MIYTLPIEFASFSQLKVRYWTLWYLGMIVESKQQKSKQTVVQWPLTSLCLVFQYLLDQLSHLVAC